jgi:DNA-directed RNA polymerase subunit beta'
MIYEPTGERVAGQGVIVDATHLETLDRIAQEHRDLVVEAARKEMERARADTEREIERARMNAEGEIASIQDQLVALSNDVRAETEARRRDLEGLKKLDLLQEQRYRELKEFEYHLRDTNPELPEIFEAGMGAEAVQSLLEDIDLDELAAKLRSEIDSTS